MIDVAVVGAGVIGCALGLELRRRGCGVTLFDQNGDVGHGSTAASCGIVRRFYSTMTMTAMALEGSLIWADWNDYLGAGDELGLARFERPGMLFIPPRMDAGVRRIAEHMRALGIAVELLEPDEITARFPFVDIRSHAPVRRPDADDFFEPTGRQIEGGVFEPDAGYVISPQIAAHNLRVAGEQAGAQFRLGRRVCAIERHSSAFRLTLQGGEVLEARAVVNVAGPHSALVNRLAGVRLPIENRALRRETHVVRSPLFSEERDASLPVVGDVDSGIYFRPEAGGRDLIVGSLDPECDALEWVENPDDLEPTPTTDAFERQVLRLMKRVPRIEMGPRRGIVGLYDVTLLDWNPILDRTDLPGYYVAIGTSGSSFKTAPVIGAVMADLILACQAGHDHDADPVKVTLPRAGFEVDLSFFSRRRGAHRSSGTVLG